MDDETNGFKPTRWLAWAAAGLLVAGLVSIGEVSAGTATDERIVRASGSGVDGVEVPTTLGQPAAPPEPPVAPPLPPTTADPTTTVPTPTTTAPPTTQPTRPTTTRPAVTSTTAAARAAGAMVTIANEHTAAFKITVNGRTFELAPGQQVGPVELTPSASGNDSVEVTAVADPTCGLGDAGNYFDAGGRYRMAIVASPGRCRAMPGPQLKVTPV